MNFFSDISLWWLFPWSIISIGISYLYYRNQAIIKNLERWKKVLLIGLRSLVVFVLGLLLIGLVVESKDIKTERPVFITLVDNSASMLNYKDSASVSDLTDSYLKEIQNAYKDRFDFATYIVDEKVSDSGFTFDGDKSNLFAGFEHIFNQYYNRNIGGICFISDGNFNQGNNPVYAADKINLAPIFTMGVGDTMHKKDQIIKHVAVNDVAFLKNKFPVEIDIESRKLKNQGSIIELLKDNKVIDSRPIKYTGQALEFHHVSFLVDANELGFVNYQVRIKHLENEASYENNQRSFYVEVIDSRSKVTLLCDAPHPDVSALKQVIEKNDNIEIESILIDEWEGRFEKTELVILHLSSNQDRSALVEKIRSKGVPVLFILGSKTSRNSLSKYNLGLDYPTSSNFDEVQVHLNSQFQLFELSDDLKDKLTKWPPLVVKFGEIRNRAGNVLLKQRIGPVKKADPVIYFNTANNSKTGVIIGEGLWRWRMDEYSKTKSSAAFDELIQKIAQYLLVKKNTDPLRINLPKRFSINEDVLINAEFYNASMEAIVTPSIDLELIDPSGKENSYTFAKGTKDYKLSLGKLQEGEYNWRAKTTFNGKNYSKKGAFIVENIDIEKLETVADHSVLRVISDNSNGSFYNLKNYKSLIDELSKRKDIVTQTYEESSYSDLIDNIWLFIILVLSLAGEWFTRRFSGSY